MRQGCLEQQTEVPPSRPRTQAATLRADRRSVHSRPRSTSLECCQPQPDPARRHPSEAGWPQTAAQTGQVARPLHRGAWLPPPPPKHMKRTHQRPPVCVCRTGCGPMAVALQAGGRNAAPEPTIAARRIHRNDIPSIAPYSATTPFDYSRDRSVSSPAGHNPKAGHSLLDFRQPVVPAA